MKVCAHITYGPFNNGHERFGSVSEALAYFRDVAGEDFGTGTEGHYEDGYWVAAQGMMLYPGCDDCTGDMNFHDYPMSAFEVGPRGGIRKVYV